ncbi:MAG TPA: alpha/beta fold hydrolase, partial [Candidatus Paceibacterota bacterium]|nr:alpha/beta fold hydrolase [Candidatus Paceibacterota bacterium]
MLEVTKKHARSADGTELYYECWRSDGHTTAPTLLFVHGLGGDIDGWQYVRDIVGAHGIPAVAFDMRGHGYSDHPKKASAYAVERMVEDIQTVMQAENLQRPTLVGHSGGAVVSAAFASKYSEPLSGLVLIAGSYCPPTYMQYPLLPTIANGVIGIGGIISPPPLKRWHSPYPPGKFHKEVEI